MVHVCLKRCKTGKNRVSQEIRIPKSLVLQGFPGSWRPIRRPNSFLAGKVARDFIGGGHLGVVVQVGVDVAGGADVAVAEPFLNVLEGYAVGVEQGRTGVPEVVKTDNAIMKPVYQNGFLEGAVFELHAAEDIIGKEGTVFYSGCQCG